MTRQTSTTTIRKRNQISLLPKKICIVVTTAIACSFGSPSLHTVAALTSASKTLANSSVKSSSGIYYQRGDEGESESRQLEHKAAVLLTHARTQKNTLSSSPMMRLVSWATKFNKPKDDLEKYMEFLGHRYSRLHDKCIVYDDRLVILSSEATSINSATQHDRLPGRIYRWTGNGAIERISHILTSMIKSIIWMSAQGNLILASQTAAPVAFTLAFVMLYKPLCWIVAALASREV